MTMGAILQFKRKTGIDIANLQDDHPLGYEEVILLLFCCLRSSCSADKVEFPFADEMELADNITPEELVAWQSSLIGNDVDDSKKKVTCPVSIEELQGFALMIGIGLNDFMALTPQEFEAAARQWRDWQDMTLHQAWEQSRLTGFLAVLPYTGKKVNNPKDFYPFPWERKQKKSETHDVEQLSFEEKFKQLEDRYGK